MSLMQFYRMETFARQVSKKANPEKKWGVADIVGEAFRQPGHCGHIVHPAPPVCLIGGRMEFLRKFETAIDGAAGTKLRCDTPVLLAAVTSWPVPLYRMAQSPEEKLRFFSWIVANLLYFRRFCEELGAQYACAICHLDETYPHLHHLILPTSSEMRAKRLLPGYGAEIDIRAKQKQRQLNKTLGIAIRRAHAEAFRAELERYSEFCGKPFGHLVRSASPRDRLSRDDWRKKRALELARTKAQAEDQLWAFVAELRSAMDDAVGDYDFRTDEPDDSCGPQR